MVAGESALLAPLAVAGGTSKGLQTEKRSIEKKLPPGPWSFIPSNLGLPSPEDILGEGESKGREATALPQRLLDTGGIPPPHQVIRNIRSTRPFQIIGEHLKSAPTPRNLLKAIPPFCDLPTIVDVMNDIERAVEDAHLAMTDGHQIVQESVPIAVENAKEFHGNVSALRNSSVELMHASAKGLTRVTHSVSALLNDFAENGIFGLLF